MVGGPNACAGCGRSTAVGTMLFSDRRSVDLTDGSRSHLCADCHAAWSQRHRGKRLSDNEVRQAVENGSVVGLLWGGGGPTIS